MSYANKSQACMLFNGQLLLINSVPSGPLGMLRHPSDDNMRSCFANFPRIGGFEVLGTVTPMSTIHTHSGLHSLHTELVRSGH